ncbi:hypothetical protein ABTM70_19700, partial [Acinetobacter baumannii]
AGTLSPRQFSRARRCVRAGDQPEDHPTRTAVSVGRRRPGDCTPTRDGPDRPKREPAGGGDVVWRHLPRGRLVLYRMSAVAFLARKAKA